MSTTCRYCEGEISEAATKCGHCGVWVTSPRDQDRYLWGRAVADHLKKDIKNGFGVSETSRS